jgi:hypothetical protein
MAEFASEDRDVDRSRRIAAAETPDDFDNVLRLRLAATDQRNRERRLGREGAAMLQAVRQASADMHATESRARDIEARGVALAERALQQLKAAEARIQAAEEVARAAEARAAEAEARAQEAEEWLARLNEAIQDGLLRRPGGSTAAA